MFASGGLISCDVFEEICISVDIPKFLLKNILDFLYLGEINVKTSDLTLLYGAAKHLGISCLASVVSPQKLKLEEQRVRRDIRMLQLEKDNNVRRDILEELTAAADDDYICDRDAFIDSDFVEPSILNTTPIPTTVKTAARLKLSDVATALLSTSVLVDYNIVSDKDKTNIICASKVQQAKKTIIKHELAKRDTYIGKVNYYLLKNINIVHSHVIVVNNICKD